MKQEREWFDRSDLGKTDGPCDFCNFPLFSVLSYDLCLRYMHILLEKTATETDVHCVTSTH